MQHPTVVEGDGLAGSQGDLDGEVVAVEELGEVAVRGVEGSGAKPSIDTTTTGDR